MNNDHKKHNHIVLDQLTSSYHYELPQEFIAQHPCAPRDHARLMVVNRQTGAIAHHYFYELADLLPTQSLVVMNNSQVICARFLGNRWDPKTGLGGKVEFLAEKILDHQHAIGMIRFRKPIWPGFCFKVFHQNDELLITVQKILQPGLVQVCFSGNPDSFGQIPIPPYLARESVPQDQIDYQTVYASQKGSIAAPTAGLHFEKHTLEDLVQKGHQICEVTLHVGQGTFRPIKSAELKEHHMHEEVYEISNNTSEYVAKAREKGRSIVAIGTTSLRALESAMQGGALRTGVQATNLFIYPGQYSFQCVDALVTNFHLPQSTLLVLVSAFSSREIILNAYEVAKQLGYRFASYGDAMLLC